MCLRPYHLELEEAAKEDPKVAPMVLSLERAKDQFQVAHREKGIGHPDNLKSSGLKLDYFERPA